MLAPMPPLHTPRQRLASLHRSEYLAGDSGGAGVVSTGLLNTHPCRPPQHVESITLAPTVPERRRTPSTGAGEGTRLRAQSHARRDFHGCAPGPADMTHI